MAVRPVVQIGEDILRVKCQEVKKFGDGLSKLLADMQDTLHAENGAGLAAPQIGVDARICVVEVDEGYYELLNPVIVHTKGEQTGPEGCLSVKGKQGTVKRPEKIKVVYRDRNGKKHTLSCEGFFARAVCHEVDHLDGIIYTDIADEIYDIDDEGRKV